MARKANGSVKQQFKLVYVDEVKTAPKKGDYLASWGFRVGSPFEIKSGLGDGKYVDLVGNNMVLKTQNGRTSQQWYFNQKTKTI